MQTAGHGRNQRLSAHLDPVAILLATYMPLDGASFSVLNDQRFNDDYRRMIPPRVSQVVPLPINVPATPKQQITNNYRNIVVRLSR